MRNRVFSAITVVMLGVAGFAACGGSDSKTIETKDGKVTVNKKGNSVTIEGENGAKATFGGTKVPDNFPSEVPLPKGLKLKSAAGGTQGTKTFFSLGYELGSKSPDDVVAAYKTQLEDAGFTINGTGNFGAGGGAVSNVSAEGKGYRVTASGVGSATGKLFTMAVTPAD